MASTMTASAGRSSGAKHRIALHNCTACAENDAEACGFRSEYVAIVRRGLTLASRLRPCQARCWCGGVPPSAWRGGSTSQPLPDYQLGIAIRLPDEVVAFPFHQPTNSITGSN